MLHSKTSLDPQNLSKAAWSKQAIAVIAVIAYSPPPLVVGLQPTTRSGKPANSATKAPQRLHSVTSIETETYLARRGPVGHNSNTTSASMPSGSSAITLICSSISQSIEESQPPTGPGYQERATANSSRQLILCLGLPL